MSHLPVSLTCMPSCCRTCTGGITHLLSLLDMICLHVCCASVQDNCQAGKAAATTIPTPAPLSQYNACSTLVRSLQLLKSTSSLLSSTQLFQQPPSAVVNFLRLEYHQTTSMLACCSQPWPRGIAWFHPPAEAVYQPARVSTNLHLCPPSCKGVHQAARVSTKLQGCPKACQRARIWSYTVSLTDCLH